MPVVPDFDDPDLFAFVRQDTRLHTRVHQPLDQRCSVAAPRVAASRLPRGPEIGMERRADAAFILLARAGVIAFDKLALLARVQPRAVGILCARTGRERRRQPECREA